VPKPARKDGDHYTGFRGLAAEGARIGLLTCLRCGATVTIDPADQGGVASDDERSASQVHDDWHDTLHRAFAEAFKP
jgi:hypothetical protein